jgi:hypothetical protein
LSSLDACAANPECAAAVSSELAPAVSAPTGAGFGASTLSTTTAAGATTSSVQGVAEISVAARLGTLGILYYWNQSQNEKAQNKAKEKYCAAYPTDLVCDAQANVVYNIEATLHSTDGTYSYDYFYSGTALGSINYAEADAPHWITGWSPPLIGIYNNDGIRTGSLGWNYIGTGGYPVDEWAQITGITITSITRQDEQPETPPSPWKDWSQEKRDEAVRLLNDSDWQGLISSMPEAGVLNPGDKINAPTIVIPGEETDDPNTPADERLLRKEHGFFTFPGTNDFDYDADGTADSADPEPQNPSVPTASSGSSGSSSDPSSTPPDSNEPLDTSQEPRPEPLSEIPETARARDLAEAKAAELYENLGKKAPTATATAVDTKTGKVYYGTSGKPLPTTIDEYLAERMPVPSEEPWEVSNCAEFKAVNDALLDGANIRDLEVHTVRTKTGQAYPRCRNCRKTIDGPNVTSDP